MRKAVRIALVVLTVALAVAGSAGGGAEPAGTGFVQDGAKLTVAGKGYFGSSVALSADGATGLIGAPADKPAGAAYVVTRSPSGWTRPGVKLLATGAEGHGFLPNFGQTVALSADGNTAVVGAPDDDHEKGAVWVFTRSDSGWTQQGPKLTGRGERGVGDGRGGRFGQTLALSDDGNTLAIGADWDDHSRGAVWVFRRVGSAWKQQGSKLTTHDKTADGRFGISVAVSADATTLLVGRFGNEHSRAGALVFTDSGSGWTLRATLTAPAVFGGSGFFGSSLALSADGNTALIGYGQGAAWVFSRAGSTWRRPGTNLARQGKTSSDKFGGSLALSADGSTALVGAPSYSNDAGAVWVFTRSGSTWRQQGTRLTGGGELIERDGGFGRSVALSDDATTVLVGGTGPGLQDAPGAVWAFRAQP